MKLEAKYRLLASAWRGEFIDLGDLPQQSRQSIEAVLNRLSADYPSVAHLNVAYGDPQAMDGALATKSNNTIYLNQKYWASTSEFDKVASDWEELRVSTDVEGVIIHEVGHVLSGQVLHKLGARKYNQLLEKYLGEGNLSAIPNWVSPSAYGQENIFEFVAEAFTSFYLGRHAIKQPNELTLRAVAACRAMWLEFNSVLHGRPKSRKAL